jgi:hypothetical protein
MPALIRADHVGSLLRPAELLHARTSHLDPAEIEAVENLHILRILQRQREIGLGIYTDGELPSSVPFHWRDTAFRSHPPIRHHSRHPPLSWQ